MKNKTWKRVLALILAVCLLTGTGVGYILATYQPSPSIQDRSNNPTSGGAQGPNPITKPEAVLSDAVAMFTEEESDALNNAIESIQSTDAGVQMVVQNGTAFDDLTVGDIFYLEGDESSPFGSTYIGKVSSMVAGDSTTSYILETPMIDEVFDKLAFSHEDMVSAENITSVDYVPGVTWVGNTDTAPATYGITSLSSVMPLDTHTGETQLLFELDLDLLKLFKKNPDDNKGQETCSYMASASKTVYTTNTGKQYHKENCQYLWLNKNKTTLMQAIDSGYKACSVCRPPLQKKDDGVLTGKSEVKLTGKLGLDELKYSVTCNWDLLSGDGIEDLSLNVDGKLLAELSVNGNASVELGGRQTEVSLLGGRVELQGLQERLLPLIAVRLGATITPIVGNDQLRNVTSTMPLSVVVVVYVDIQGRISTGLQAYISYEKDFHYNKTLYRDGQYVNETSSSADPGEWSYGIELEAKGDVDANVGCGLDVYIFNLKLAQLDLIQFGFEAEGNAKLQYSNKVASGEEDWVEAKCYARLYLKLLQLKLCFKAKIELLPFLDFSLNGEFDYVVLDRTLKEWGAKLSTSHDSSTMSHTSITAKDEEYIYYMDLDGSLVREKDGYRTVLYTDPFFSICGIDESYIYLLESASFTTYNLRRVSKTDQTTRVLAEDVVNVLAFDKDNIYYLDNFDDSVIRKLDRQTLEDSTFASFSDSVVFMAPQEDDFYVAAGYSNILWSSFKYYRVDKDGQTVSSYGGDPAVSNLYLVEYEDYYVAKKMASSGYLRDSCSAFYWLSKNKSTSIQIKHMVGWNNTDVGIFTVDEANDSTGKPYQILLYQAKDGSCREITTVVNKYAFFTLCRGPQGEWYFFDQTAEELILYTMDANFGNLKEVKRLDLGLYPCDLGECSVIMLNNRIYFYTMPNMYTSQVLYRYDIV